MDADVEAVVESGPAREAGATFVSGMFSTQLGMVGEVLGGRRRNY